MPTEKLEKLLEDSKRAYQILNAVKEGIVYIDPDREVKWVNEPGAALAGESPQEVIGSLCYEAFYDLDSPCEGCPVTETLETGQPAEGEISGSDDKTFLVSSEPVRDEEGELIGFIETVQTITDQKRVEAELAREQRLLKTLMENFPDAIYFKDKESRFIQISQAQAERFGLDSPDQAVGKTDFDFFTEEHAQPAYEDEQEIMRTGQPIVGKVEKETWPDGQETWASTTKAPLRNEAGEIIGTLGITRDITERKEMENELKEYSERLEEKVRERTKTILELSTPVIAVWEGVLTVPILGTIDSERAQQITEKLLEEVKKQEARVAIIDVSGIVTVDSAVANHLIRTAKAIRLIGAIPLLTGINPDIAQTISRLGIELDGLKTLATLKDGIQYAIDLMKE